MGDEEEYLLELGEKLENITSELKQIMKLLGRFTRKEPLQLKQQQQKNKLLAGKKNTKQKKKNLNASKKTISKRKLNESDLPKKPAYPFVLFTVDLHEQFCLEKLKDPTINIAKLKAQRWKELSDKGKKVYQDKYKVLKRQWEEEVSRYNRAKKNKEYSESDEDIYSNQEGEGEGELGSTYEEQLESTYEPDLESIHSPNLFNTTLEINHNLNSVLTELYEEVHHPKSYHFEELPVDEIEGRVNLFEHVPNSNNYEELKSITDLVPSTSVHVTSPEHNEKSQDQIEHKVLSLELIKESKSNSQFENNIDHNPEAKLKINRVENKKSKRAKKEKKDKKAKKSKKKASHEKVSENEDDIQTGDFLGF